MIRIPAAIFQAMQANLLRPHAFAGERVGFLIGRKASLPGDAQGIMVHRYLLIPDDLYLRDPLVGAAISGAAIRLAMQEALTSAACIVHVHLHDHPDPPRFSRTDIEGYRQMLPSFRNASPKMPHAAVVFSPGGATALLLEPQATSWQACPVTVVGFPLRLWGRNP